MDWYLGGWGIRTDRVSSLSPSFALLTVLKNNNNSNNNDNNNRRPNDSYMRTVIAEVYDKTSFYSKPTFSCTIWVIHEVAKTMLLFV